MIRFAAAESLPPALESAEVANANDPHRTWRRKQTPGRNGLQMEAASGAGTSAPETHPARAAALSAAGRPVTVSLEQQRVQGLRDRLDTYFAVHRMERTVAHVHRLRQGTRAADEKE